MNDFSVRNNFDLFNRLRACDLALRDETLSACFGVRTLEDAPGIFAIDRGEQHWTRGDKTTPCFQAVDPSLVTEPARQVHIDPAEAQWNRMHAVGCPSGRARRKTAIQQRVVGQ